MSDIAIAGMLLAFLIGLAVAAPIWGVDSRDGVDSDQSARRVAWLSGGWGRNLGQHAPTQTAGLVMAGLLRSAADRIDADACVDHERGRQVAIA